METFQVFEETPHLEAFDELFSDEEPSTGNRHAFIVRVWSETNDDDRQAASWRGSIESVGSNRRLYFHDFNAIRRFIEETLHLSEAQSLSWWQSLLHKLHFDE